MAAANKPSDEAQGNHVADKIEDDPAQDEEEKKVDADGDKAAAAKANDSESGVDFSGSWELSKNSDNIDAYYKAEKWSWMMRKAIPMITIKQIITQKGDKLTIRILVGPGGKFANEETETVIGGSDEFEFKDKDGPQKGLSKWNEDRTRILSETWRVEDESRRYKSVRYFAENGAKMMIETTNKSGITLTQTFVREKQ